MSKDKKIKKNRATITKTKVKNSNTTPKSTKNTKSIATKPSAKITKKLGKKTKLSITQEPPLTTIAKTQPQAPLPTITGKKPVILQILPELKSGGVERGTIEIAKAGTQLGYEMLVASNGGHLVGQLENAHITHITLPLASKNPFVILGNIARIRKIIKKQHVNIVHARSRAPAWSAYFAARKSRCHFITTFHGTYSYGSKLKKLYNSVMTKGEIVIAISEFIKKHIIDDYGINPKKIKLVPRGVDLDQFTRDKVHKMRIINMAAHFRIELDVPIILLPARFARWKGHEFLIDALALIKDEKFVCIFAGYEKKHEAYHQELENKVKELNLFHKIRMIGEVKDMPALYNLSDIVVSSSLKPEAFGRIAIEAQAMERLVVATNHGGSLETIKDRETGWLVNPGDVEALAKILKDLLHISPKNRKNITSRARKNIETNFSIDNMIYKTFMVYNEILGIK